MDAFKDWCFFQSGVVSILRKNVGVNSKSVQVTLADTVTLKRLSASRCHFFPLLFSVEYLPRVFLRSPTVLTCSIGTNPDFL